MTVNRIQQFIRRRRFREGRVLSRFIACDIRREVLIISAARVDEGVIAGRVRTTNLLYRSKGLIPAPEFGPVQELRIKEMWHWTGQSWGGLPDGSSIVDQAHRHHRGMQTATTDRVDQLLSVFLRTREALGQPDNDFSWSSWPDAEAALREVDGIIESLQSRRLPDKLQMQVLFAPTGPVQEVSLSSGWGHEFLQLASEFDSALARAGA